MNINYNNVLLMERVINEKNNAITYESTINIDILGIKFVGTAKLDSGCNFTNIPIKKLRCISNSLDINDLKNKIISSGYRTSLSFGVNDTEDLKEKIKGYYHNKEYDKCSPYISYKIPNQYLTLNMYSFKSNIKLNFDRSNNILIGADILDRMIFCKGYSKIAENSIIIAVLENQENKNDYYRACYEHLHIYYDNTRVVERIHHLF